MQSRAQGGASPATPDVLALTARVTAADTQARWLWQSSENEQHPYKYYIYIIYMIYISIISTLILLLNVLLFYSCCHPMLPTAAPSRTGEELGRAALGPCRAGGTGRAGSTGSSLLTCWVRPAGVKKLQGGCTRLVGTHGFGRLQHQCEPPWDAPLRGMPAGTKAICLWSSRKTREQNGLHFCHVFL